MSVSLCYLPVNYDYYKTVDLENVTLKVEKVENFIFNEEPALAQKLDRPPTNVMELFNPAKPNSFYPLPKQLSKCDYETTIYIIQRHISKSENLLKRILSYDF